MHANSKARNQTNIFILNGYLTKKMLNKKVLQKMHTLQIKAVDGL